MLRDTPSCTLSKYSAQFYSNYILFSFHFIAFHTNNLLMGVLCIVECIEFIQTSEENKKFKTEVTQKVITLPFFIDSNYDDLKNSSTLLSVAYSRRRTKLNNHKP